MNDVPDMEELPHDLPIIWDTSVPGLVSGQDAELELLIVISADGLFKSLTGRERPLDAKGPALEDLRLTIKPGRGVDLQCEKMDREGVSLFDRAEAVQFGTEGTITVGVRIPKSALPALHEMHTIARIRVEVCLAKEHQTDPGQMHVIGQSVGMPVIDAEEFAAAVAEMQAQRFT